MKQGMGLTPLRVSQVAARAGSDGVGRVGTPVVGGVTREATSPAFVWPRLL